jgi:hypothetical protein
MEQTVVHATEDFLRDSLAKATLRIGQLEEQISTVTQRSITEAAERSIIRNEMQDWALNALKERLISESDAEEISNICGFELTQEFEVEATVLYSITVNARSEEDAINLIHEIDFDSVSEPQGVTYLSSSVDRVEI